MMHEDAPFFPDWVSPPGETIRDILALRSMSPADLADMMGCSASFAQRLLEGQEAIDVDVARALEDALGPSAKFWVNREKQYRAGALFSQFDNVELSERDWVRQLPIADMTKFGWIKATRSVSERLEACLSFFGVPSVRAWQEAYQGLMGVAAFRTSPSFEANPAAVSAWLHRAKLQSGGIECADWNPEKLREALPELRKLTWIKDPLRFVPRLTRICADCGVALVIARAPTGCRASGATLFLSERKAMIVLSFRYRTDDQFWFTFFHEIGHLLLHGMDAIFLEDGSDVTMSEEQEADAFSGETLIPVEAHSRLAKLRHNVNDVVRFATALGVAPGIVVGQMQHRELLAPNRLNSLKRRYKWEDVEKIESAYPLKYT